MGRGVQTILTTGAGAFITALDLGLHRDGLKLMQQKNVWFVCPNLHKFAIFHADVRVSAGTTLQCSQQPREITCRAALAAASYSQDSPHSPHEEHETRVKKLKDDDGDCDANLKKQK